MTLIKSEPNTDGSDSLSEGRNAGNLKTKDMADSRPALGSKKINVANSKKEATKDMNKRKFEEFLLDTGGSRQPNSNAADHVKATFSFDKTIIKKEPEFNKSASHSNYSTPVKKATESGGSSSNEKRKLKTDEKLKKMVADNETRNSEAIEAPSKNPGPYVPITEMLYESNSKFLREPDATLFQDLDQEFERKFCQEASQWSLPEWINQGQILLNAHTNLVGQLVRERIELSSKFRAITSAINDRAEALNRQGQLLDDKLKKIETLGKEILDII